MSQSELSRITGIPQPAISAFERGAEEMGLKRIKVLAMALHVHPAVIAFPDWQAEIIPLTRQIAADPGAELPVAKRRRGTGPRRR